MTAPNRLRTMAVICVVLGILQTIYAGLANSKISDTFFGCWWAGVVIAISALSTGMCATNTCRMSTAMGVSIVATIVGFVGAILDAVAFGYLHQLETCTNQDRDVFGNEDWRSFSNLCQLGNPEYDCVCVRATTDTDCYGFYLNDDSSGDANCDIVLVTTPQLLHAAFAICFVATFMMLFFSCVSCGSTCCPNKCCGPAEGDHAEANLALNAPLSGQQVHSSMHSAQSVHVVHESAHLHQPPQVVVAEPVIDPPSTAKNNYV